ncbi:hypothetical protein GCM10009682_39360 [Luedemannella flava]|uniref:Uncharacterized protein n=1 Tax=Luedemannella flava TaxID=349316 RepID=A0ABP4YKH8_9ACTN
MTDGRPRTRYTIGATAAFLIRASRILSDRMTTSDLRKHYAAEDRGRTTATHTARPKPLPAAARSTFDTTWRPRPPRTGLPPGPTHAREAVSRLLARQQAATAADR